MSPQQHAEVFEGEPSDLQPGIDRLLAQGLEEQRLPCDGRPADHEVLPPSHQFQRPERVLGGKRDRGRLRLPGLERLPGRKPSGCPSGASAERSRPATSSVSSVLRTSTGASVAPSRSRRSQGRGGAPAATATCAAAPRGRPAAAAGCALRWSAPAAWGAHAITSPSALSARSTSPARQKTDELIVFTHTEVDPSLEGQGVGGHDAAGFAPNRPHAPAQPPASYPIPPLEEAAWPASWASPARPTSSGAHSIWR